MLLAAILTGCALITKAPPIANAGPDVTVRIGERVSHDGSGSVDLDGGRIVYYKWYVTVAPEGREDQVGQVLREGPNAATWTSDSPVGEQDLGEWVIELWVTDDEGQSATDDMTLKVIR
jgi:hypothetical protein